MRKSPEADLQKACVNYLSVLENQKRLRFHTNLLNVQRGDQWAARQGANNKAMGVRKGFPDMVLLFPGGKAVYVELKSAKGVLSAEQKEWKNWLLGNGFGWALVRSIEEMKAVCEGSV